MKITFLKKLTLCIVSCVFCAVAHAQINATIHIYRFSLQSSFSPHGQVAKKDVDQSFWYKNGSAWASFGKTGSDDIRISYQGPKTLTLYRKVGKGNDDKDYRAVSRVDLPNAGEIFMLMIESGNSASFYPINVSPDKIPKGKIAIMNMTKRGLAIMFGEDKKFLRSYANAVFTQRKRNVQSEPIVIAAKVQGKWEISYRSRMTYQRDRRSLMLIYDSSNKEIPSLNVSIVQF